MPVIHGGAAVVEICPPQEERFRLMFKRSAVVSPEAQLPQGISDALAHLAELREGWDSYGAPSIPAPVLEKARQIVADLYRLATLSGLRIPEPRILAGGDGSVGLHWSDTRRAGGFEVTVDGPTVGFVASRAGEVSGDGLLHSAEELLAELRQHILAA
jgi:hypothetical protein